MYIVAVVASEPFTCIHVLVEKRAIDIYMGSCQTYSETNCQPHFPMSPPPPHEAMQLLEVLSPMRNSAEEALATQLEVFDDGHHADLGQLDMPGGVDINSHSDVFNAVFGKV